MHESAVPEVDADVGGFLSFLVEGTPDRLWQDHPYRSRHQLAQRIRVARKRNPDLRKL